MLAPLKTGALVRLIAKNSDGCHILPRRPARIDAGYIHGILL